MHQRAAGSIRLDPIRTDTDCETQRSTVQKFIRVPVKLDPIRTDTDCKTQRSTVQKFIRVPVKLDPIRTDTGY